MGKSTNLFKIALGIGGAITAVALVEINLNKNIINIKKILNHINLALKI